METNADPEDDEPIPDYITSDFLRAFKGVHGKMTEILELCDCCHDDFPIQQLEIDGTQLLCAKCKSAKPTWDITKPDSAFMAGFSRLGPWRGRF